MRGTPKETGWRRNRKFGDVYGGRVRPRLVDNVFNRCHSLPPPGPHDELPLTITDNPSRDFVFPASAEEVVKHLQKLPKQDTAGLTHLWLRRLRKRDYEAGDLPQAAFICGSGVRLIVLYPWPADLLLRLGKKVSQRTLRAYERWCSDLIEVPDGWALQWTEDALRRYTLEHLLLHEVGHHVDWYQRRWSKANRKQIEDFADNYAAWWSTQGQTTFSS